MTVFYHRFMDSMTMGFRGRRGWEAVTDMPRTLVAALYLRDAGGLEVRAGNDVPPLEPFVDDDGALVPYATEAAAAAWGPWWDGLLNRHPEFRGVPPLVPDPFPELPIDLRALIGIGLPAADAWFEARRFEDRMVRRHEREGRVPRQQVPVNEIVEQVEAELGREAAAFSLLISVLPVTGVWGRRVRRDHVLVSRALRGYAEGFAALLEPVVRDLAA